ncbi:MAG: DUF1674 domain-containing protein [Pseudomonadota bacterium]
MSDNSKDTENQEATAARSFEDLPPAAQRALEEAQARREKIDKKSADQPTEIDGRGGKDPARYGDWEVKGLAVDF